MLQSCIVALLYKSSVQNCIQPLPLCFLHNISPILKQNFCHVDFLVGQRIPQGGEAFLVVNINFCSTFQECSQYRLTSLAFQAIIPNSVNQYQQGTNSMGHRSHFSHLLLGIRSRAYTSRLQYDF